ncbi:MAG: TatD family hydrolase, partial [Thermoanaerobaculia bacterium]
MSSLPAGIPLFDTHAHLCDPGFDPDRDAVLERARGAGVQWIVAVGETLVDAGRNLELAQEYPDVVRPAAGLFPTRLDLEQAEAVIELIRRERGRLVAIGEVGLDYWKVQGEAERELQQEILGRFVEVAQQVDLPLNVHSRAAGRQTIDLLIQRGAKKVQLHAFDGRPAKALPGVEAGYFFSVPPSVVRSRQKQKLVRRLPLSCLLLETDSPVLGPEPSERNEPANLPRALLAICEIKGLAPEQAAAALADNTRRLYQNRGSG